MGTVSSTLKLKDQMSPILRQIIKSMEMTMRVMEQVDHSAQGADFSKQFGLARHEIQNTLTMLDRMEQEIDQAGNEQRQLNQQIREGKTAASGLSMAFTEINSAIALAQRAWQEFIRFASFADEIVLTGARLQLIDNTSPTDLEGTITMQVREVGLSETEQKIMDSANRAGALYTDTAAAVSKLGILAGKAFDSNDEIIAFSELMNKSFAVGGSGIQEQTAAIYQLTQAMAAGKLQGDEYRSITENAPMLAKSIETYMREVQGAEGSMKDWSAAGLLTAEVVKNSMFMAATEIEDAFAGLPKTWGRATNTFKNDMTERMMPAIAKFSAMVNSPDFLLLTSAAAQSLGLLVMMGTAAFEALGSVVGAVVSIILGNLDVISVILGGWIIAQIPALVAGLWGMVAPILVAAGGWVLANWPLLIFIAGVGMLIANMKQFGATTEDVTGMVGEVFGWLYGVVYNLIADLWNFIAIFAEFFANVFNDPVGSIVRLFFGLLDTILSIVETAANAIDAVLGSNLASTVTSFRKNMDAWVEEKIAPAKVTIERMEKLDVRQTMDQGAQIGRDFATFADDFLAGTSNLFGEPGKGFDFGSMYDPNVMVGGGNLDSVGRINDDVTISEEDIKLLKDIASMNYQLHYTQLTPQMTANFGDIRETADAGAILAFIESSLEESLSSSLLVGV